VLDTLGAEASAKGLSYVKALPNEKIMVVTLRRTSHRVRVFHARTDGSIVIEELHDVSLAVVGWLIIMIVVMRDERFGTRRKPIPHATNGDEQEKLTLAKLRKIPPSMTFEWPSETSKVLSALINEMKKGERAVLAYITGIDTTFDPMPWISGN
jgi:hypothetical protein